MAFIIDDAYDALLDEIETSTRMVLCSSEPANFAAISAATLGTITIDGSDFTQADGDTSGRKTTIAQQTGTASASGTATHIALDDGTDLQLTVALSSSRAVVNTESFTVSAFKVEVADAT